MNINYDELTFRATEEYLQAIRQLMEAQIKMMRGVDGGNAECWYCGAAKIGNLAQSNSLEILYGGKEDMEYLRERANVFIEVPF